MPFQPAPDAQPSEVLHLIPIALRETTNLSEGERHLILSSWIKSYKRNDMFGPVHTQTYFENYRPLVQKLISLSSVLFACNPEDQNQIYGFVVFRRKDEVAIISSVYVKETFRRMKVARRMVEQITRDASDPGARAFITHTLWWFNDTIKRNGLIYNPFLDLKLLGDNK